MQNFNLQSNWPVASLVYQPNRKLTDTINWKIKPTAFRNSKTQSSNSRRHSQRVLWWWKNCENVVLTQRTNFISQILPLYGCGYPMLRTSCQYVVNSVVNLCAFCDLITYRIISNARPRLLFEQVTNLPACIRDPASIGDQACIETSTCRTKLFFCIQCAWFQMQYKTRLHFTLSKQYLPWHGLLLHCLNRWFH